MSTPRAPEGDPADRPEPQSAGSGAAEPSTDTAAGPAADAADPAADESAGEPGADPTAGPAAPPTPARWRRPVTAVLVALGALTAPVALVAHATHAQLSSTDAFVAAYAPLARDPQVQQLVARAAADAAIEHLDLEGQVDQVIASIAEDRSRTTGVVLELLRGPLLDAMSSAVHRAADAVVTSPAFATLWEHTLRIGHRQISGAIRGEDTVLGLDDDGVLALRLDPVLTALRDRLVENGWRTAALIPTSDRVLVLMESDDLLRVRGAAHALDTAAGVLPWVAVALLVAGVAVAVRRRRTAAWAAIGVALAAGALLGGLALGRHTLTGAFSAALSADAVLGIYDAASGGLGASTWLLLVAGLVVGGALLGPRLVARFRDRRPVRP